MVKAKLIIDEKEINVLWFTFGFNQGADPSGRPSQKPMFLGLKLTIETRKDLNLAEWSFSANQTKQIELHIYPVTMGGKTRKLYFYDCHLVNWGNNFNAIGNDPMTETLEITCAGVKDSNSMAEYSTYWRTTYTEKTNINTEKETEEEAELIIKSAHFEDTEGNIIKEKEVGFVFLVVKAENYIGKKATFDLTDKEHNFKYNGKVLKNDILENVALDKAVTKIELEIIEE